MRAWSIIFWGDVVCVVVNLIVIAYDLSVGAWGGALFSLLVAAVCVAITLRVANLRPKA